MQNADGPAQRMEPPGDRLSRLSAASLRINESLDLAGVLQGVLDCARTLTDARYALITTLDDSGQVDDFLIAGLTGDETRRLQWPRSSGKSRGRVFYIPPSFWGYSGQVKIMTTPPKDTFAAISA